MAEKDILSEIMKIVDKWNFEECAFCDHGNLVPLEGTSRFKCEKCGKTIFEGTYLGEIAKILYNYKEDTGDKSD